MKLNAAEATRFIERPDRTLAAVLIYGPDEAETTERKNKLVTNILGRGREKDLSLTRISGAELRKDPAHLLDSLKSDGFFSDQRVVIAEEITDTHSAAIESAVKAARAGDAFLIVAAGSLTPRSKLRKFFESARNAASAPCYGPQISPGLLSEMITAAGGRAAPAALDLLVETCRNSSVAATRELIEKLVLYRLADHSEIAPEDIALFAEAESDADSDELTDAVLLGKADLIGGLLARMESQGQSTVSITISLSRRLRAIHYLLSQAGNPGQAINSLRPPIYGPRRDMLLNQAKLWPRKSVETALRLVLELDDSLRRRSDISAYVLMERCFIKIAIVAARLKR